MITNLVARVGRYCSISEQVGFAASNHPSTWLTGSPFAYDPRHPPFADHLRRGGRQFSTIDWGYGDEEYGGGVIVGNDVWIGAGAYIRGGVTLGDGCIVGSRTVVTRDVPPFGVVVGNPGRVVKSRFPVELVDQLLELRWWDYDFADFDGVDLRDPAVAVVDLRRRKEEGRLTPLVPLRPFGEVLQGVVSRITSR